MIALVTLLFGFTWLPLHSFLFAMKVLRCFPFGSSYLFTIKTLTHTLTYLNSMLNPFFYTIMGNNFRKKLCAEKIKYSSRLKSRFSPKDNPNTGPASVYYTNSNKMVGRLSKCDFTTNAGARTRNSIQLNSNSSSNQEQIVLLNSKRNMSLCDTRVYV